MTHSFSANRFRTVAPTCVVAAAILLSLGAMSFGQQKSQAQKPEPKEQAQTPAPAQPAAPQMPSLIYSNWTKLCSKSAETGGKTICRTGRDGRLESGTPMVGAVLSEVEGEQRKSLQVMLPLGILLPRGTRVLIDNNEQDAIVLPIIVCSGGGCMAQTEANEDLVAKLKKGQNLYVQAYNMQQTVFTLAVPLADFAKAYDGPPTDPQDAAERKKKLQEELAKRGRERLQQQK